MTNGSWTGRDPRLRNLRTFATFVLLGLLAFMVVDPMPDDTVMVGTIIGALLVNLGFEAGVRLPGSKP